MQVKFTSRFSGRLSGFEYLNRRLLTAAILLPLVMACDSDGTVVTSVSGTATETPAEVNDSVVDVAGDPAENAGQTPACIDSPPVGDGWGWNGTESCRIGETGDTSASGGDANNQTSGNQTADNQTTNNQSQECVDTPPVGDGWGWNGSASCRIGNTQTTTNTGNNTGANTNTGSQTLSDETVLLRSVTDLVLVTGQSNALGAGTGYDEFLDAPNPNVLAYTDLGWQVADLNQVWDRDWHPRNNPNTPPSNNFSLHFGKRVVEKSPDRVVGFILLTSPGSRISEWGPESELFIQIRNKVSQAINELPDVSRLSAILWHQGESDSSDSDAYGAALYDLINRFRSEPWFGGGRPFVCGETAGAPVNNQLNRLNTDADPWTACVEGEGLAVIAGTDHFNAASLRTIGQRYGDAYLRMWLGIE